MRVRFIDELREGWSDLPPDDRTTRHTLRMAVKDWFGPIRHVSGMSGTTGTHGAGHHPGPPPHAAA